MLKIKCSRDKNRLPATLCDASATDEKIDKLLEYNSIRYFTRHATILCGVFYVCTHTFFQVLRFLPTNFSNLFFCRVSRECATFYININNSLSLNTQTLGGVISRDISRDTMKTASRRDKIHSQILALAWRVLWFLV